MLIKGSFEQLHFDGLMVMVLKLKNIKEVLLMVQKSHSQPHVMVLKPCKKNKQKYLPYELVQDIFHQQ